MHSLEELQKQKIELDLPKYLLERVDKLTYDIDLNRTDVIIESIKSYVETQEMQNILYDPKKDRGFLTLDELLSDI